MFFFVRGLCEDLWLPLSLHGSAESNEHSCFKVVCLEGGIYLSVFLGSRLRFYLPVPFVVLSEMGLMIVPLQDCSGN